MRFDGAQNHAGTTEMRDRRDALAAAFAFGAQLDAALGDAAAAVGGAPRDDDRDRDRVGSESLANPSSRMPPDCVWCVRLGVEPRRAPKGGTPARAPKGTSTRALPPRRA